MKNLSLSIVLIVSFCVFLHVAAAVPEKKVSQSRDNSFFRQSRSADRIRSSGRICKRRRVYIQGNSLC